MGGTSQGQPGGHQSQLGVASFNLRNLLSGDVAPSVNSDSGEQSETASATSRAARERGIPVISAAGDAVPSESLMSGLLSFSMVRARTRTDLTQAADPAAEAIAIAHELAGQAPGTLQQEFALLYSVGARILKLLG